MPRPPHPRRVDRSLQIPGFKPIGRPVWQSQAVTLGLDGLEALRLADLEGLYQEAAAEHMGVSRPTFARILARARAAVAEALVEGKVLLIGEAPVVEGGSEPIPCPIHWGGRRRGRGCRCRGGRWTGAGAGTETTTDTSSEEPAGGPDGEV
jgi:predicted DNA-binding protein (UPF0251 family)